MTTVGVFLSGCGHMDGAEITESVLTLLHLDRAQARAVCISIDVPQQGVVDHAAGKPAPGQTRNCLQESARIARGAIRDSRTVKAQELDALIFPGGYGAAKNLCNFAQAGADARPHPEVARLVRELWAAKKPIGAICIAPALLAACLKDRAPGLQLTIGDDPDTAKALAGMGAVHRNCTVTGFAVDPKHKIVTTPAYMFGDARPSQVSDGIEKLVKEVLALARA
jgi:enhancing lycopene biosynthesis protein 2